MSRLNPSSDQKPRDLPVLNPPQFGGAGPLPDPEGFHNSETARLFAYHDRTKHTYFSVRTIPHVLDWENQPKPFRTFTGTPTVALPLPVSLTAPLFRTLRELPTWPDVSSREPDVSSREIDDHAAGTTWDLPRLSALLFHSLAISAWKRVRGTDFRYSLRVNPSAGNLHPTEAYLALREANNLPAGLYHYRAADHTLECRRSGSAIEAMAALLGQPQLAGADLLAILSSIFWRESWKYRDRAYRYCLHDMGHAMGSLMVAARGLGVPARGLGHFADIPVADFLGVSVQDEGPIVVLAFGGGAAGCRQPARGPSDPRPWQTLVSPLQGTPNVLSEEEVPYYLLTGMHQSTLLPDPPGPSPTANLSAAQGAADPVEVLLLPSAPRSDPPVDRIVRRRRSALDFDPAPWLPLGDLGTILYHATRGFAADFRAESLISLYLYVNRVIGLDPGVYRYAPARHGLILLKQGNVAERAAYLSLEQELASHACAVFSMIADLERAAATYGNRGYRYAHIEAGFIGQGLYLGAEGLGWNATGIGAFYDDEVQHFLELPPEQGQVIYHFAIGRAVHDDRLITET